MGWSYTLGDLATAVGGQTSDPTVRFARVSKDTRTIAPGDVFVALHGENFDGEAFVDEAFARGAAAAVCREPHEAGPCIVVPDALAALQAFASYHRDRHSIPVLALTGSCGKTTSKDFIAAVLSTKRTVVKTTGNLNNEIGCPLSLLQIDADTEVAVIEMGANHAGEIANLCAIVKPTESAITMIAPAHLEGFGTVEAVAKAKGEIAEALDASGTFYLNTDDARCVVVASSLACNIVQFGSTGDVALKNYELLSASEARLTIDPIGDLQLALPCRAHTTNVLLAVAVGLHHGITDFKTPLQDACARATRFQVVEVGPLHVIDDTYNSNPASAAAALRALVERPGNGKRLAALGDMLELGEEARRFHQELGELAAQLGVAGVYAFGDYATDIADAAKASGVPHAEAFSNHQHIADAIHRDCAPGDVLLAKGSRGMRMERVIDSLKALYEL